MKIFRFFILTALSCILIFFLINSCEEQKPQSSMSFGEAEEITPTPSPATNGKKEEPPIRYSEKTDFQAKSQSPKINLHEGENLIQGITQNIDIDSNEEQLLVTKNQKNDTPNIMVSIVDYDTVRNTNIRSWSTYTKATNIRSFSLSLQDLLGDHNLEIVCFGINDDQEQTLNIYRKVTSSDKLGLQFEEIFSIAVDGTIEIQKSERSQAYRLGQKDGISFPIVTQRSDPESENMMDLVKTTYYWQYQKNKYIPVKTEKIPGEKIEGKKLKKLFAGTKQDFEQFLAGPWYRSESGNSNSAEQKAEEIIYFSPENEAITFYKNNIQELYVWSTSNPTIYKGLYIYAHNKALPLQRKWIAVYVKAIDSIELVIRGNDEWSGVYRRLPEELQEKMIQAQFSEVSCYPGQAEGLYKSDRSIEIEFDYPSFTMETQEGKKSGGYTFFKLDSSSYLQLEIIKPNGLIQEIRTYQAEYNKTEQDTRIIRTLKLTPCKLSVDDTKLYSEESITLRQIEILEKEKTEEN